MIARAQVTNPIQTTQNIFYMCVPDVLPQALGIDPAELGECTIWLLAQNPVCNWHNLRGKI